MELVMCMIFVLGLPNSYPSQETGNSSIKLVFPKDRKISGRIIGGEVVPSHIYPFQVGIRLNTFPGLPWCGGSLISTIWVLTAAHCFDGDHDFVIVSMGDVLLTSRQIKPNTIIMTTMHYVIHEGYKSGETNVINDIALMKLPKSVRLNQYINTVRYAIDNENYTDDIGTTIGWGNTAAQEISYADVPLKKLKSRIMSKEECNQYFRRYIPYMDIIDSSHLCLSGEGIVGTCFGDSGGPLLVNNVLVGITSFGIENCSAGAPSVFTRVSYFQDWIRHHAIESRSYKSSYNPIQFQLLYALFLEMYIMYVVAL